MLDVKKRTSLTREKMLADAIREFVAELRLVDVADYVAYLRFETFANIADIVASSSELSLKPGVLRFANSGDVDLSWGTKPIVALALEFQHDGVTAHFRLELSAATAAIDITYVDFTGPSGGEESDTERFGRALADARLVGPGDDRSR
ncbi:hypothetical protein U0C82_07125 [Fulvimarina sp. 2208YS6-2-32]|uniref:Uncharacterized protein n=1 Tax=Fulvimarina uroteuthidis TaxID=3098149 RepID=A0ABU5I0L1_9HYPH|nr:hypothetical protein [Fulvimarina sp. 2208YS6-2-32]MDY8108915.1 hypothetical protein [Fulvimarina sp. 2208YS6-2-32]